MIKDSLKVRYLNLLQYYQQLSQKGHEQFNQDYIYNCTNPDSFKQFNEYKQVLHNIFASNLYNSREGILLYHSVGSGKTLFSMQMTIDASGQPLSAIAIVKRSLYFQWLETQKKHNFTNISIFKYNEPSDDTAQQFYDLFKTKNPRVIIIDEVHSFIKNLMIFFEPQGVRKVAPNVMQKQVYSMYTLIVNNIDRLRVIALSATPILNDPFEMSLLFNMLRKNILDTNYKKFSMYYQDLNPQQQDSLVRRLFGLTSYLNLKQYYFLKENRTMKIFPEFTKPKFTADEMDEVMAKIKNQKPIADFKTFKTYYSDLYAYHPKGLFVAFNALQKKEKMVVFSKEVQHNLQRVEFIFKAFGIKYTNFTGLQDIRQREADLKVFNEPSNVLGEQSQVLLLSRIGLEGLSVFDSKVIFVLDAQRIQKLKQIFGRINRICSHINLTKHFTQEQMVIEQYILLTEYELTKYNEYLQEYNRIHEMEQILVRSAFDCRYSTRITGTHETCYDFSTEEFIDIFNQGKYIQAPLFIQDQFGDRSQTAKYKQLSVKILPCVSYRAFAQSPNEETIKTKQQNYLVTEDFFVYNNEFRFFVGKLYVQNGIPLSYKGCYFYIPYY